MVTSLFDVRLYSHFPVPGAVLATEGGDNTGQGKSIRDTYSEARKTAHDIISMTTWPSCPLGNDWIRLATMRQCGRSKMI